MDGFEKNYGISLDEWEQSWHSWIRSSEKKPRKEFAPPETIMALRELIDDESQPLGERASYLRHYAGFAGEASLPLLRQYADSEGPLGSSARYGLFFLGEKIRKSHRLRVDSSPTPVEPCPGGAQGGHVSCPKTTSNRGFSFP